MTPDLRQWLQAIVGPRHCIHCLNTLNSVLHRELCLTASGGGK